MSEKFITSQYPSLCVVDQEFVVGDRELSDERQTTHVDQIYDAIERAKDSFRPRYPCTEQQKQAIFEIAKEIASSIAGVTNIREKAELILNFVPLIEDGAMHVVTKAALPVLLQNGATQPEILEAWIQAPCNSTTYNESFQQRERINAIFGTNTPLNQEGAQHIKQSIKRLKDTYLLKVEFGRPGDAVQRFTEFRPIIQELLLATAIEVASPWAMPYVGYMDEAQQRAYFGQVVQKTIEDKGVIASNVYRHSFLKVAAAEIKLPLEELEELAHSMNNPEMMVAIGVRGFEGVNIEKWIDRFFEEAAPSIRQNGTSPFVESLVKTMRSPNHGSPLDAAAERSIRDMIYQAAIHHKAHGAIVTGVRGINDNADKDLAKSPFLDIIQQRGEDYIELYRQRCREQKGHEIYFADHLTEVVRWSGSREALVAQAIADVMIEEMGFWGIKKLISDAVISKKQETFSSEHNTIWPLEMNERELIRYIVSKGKALEVVKLLDRGIECAESWMASGGIVDVLASLDREEMTPSEFSWLLDVLDERRELVAATHLDERTYFLLRTLRQTQNCMPLAPTIEGFRRVMELRSGILSDEARAIGITHMGPRGIDQLKQIVSRITNEVQSIGSSEEVVAKALNDPLYRSIVSTVYRVDKDELYGSRLGEILQSYHERAAGIQPMHSEFYPKTYTIQKNKTTAEVVQITQDVKERLEMLAGDIAFVVTENGREKVIQELATTIADQVVRLHQEIEAVQTGKDEQYNALLSDTAREFYLSNAEKRLIGAQKALRYIESGEGEFTNLFKELYTMNSCSMSLRRLGVAEFIGDLGGAAELELVPIPVSEVTIDQVKKMKEFLEKLKNVYRFEDKKVRQAYQAMMSPRAFEKLLDRYDHHIVRSNSVQITFQPTRGIAMELSGYVGDVCWTRLKGLITEQFPHITAVILKRATGDGQQLIGSALMVETQDSKGNKVLALRGINPIENQINKMDAVGFLGAAEDFCRSMAQAIGATPAIVLDGSLAGAATNRPALFEAMSTQCQSYPLIPINDPAAAFNGYSLTGVTRQIV